MKLEKLVGDRFKERPADCVIDSHALMVKGGYIKYVANGIYSSFLPLKRITRKIEQILREEMDRKYSSRLLCLHLSGKNPEDMKASETSCFVLQTETVPGWYLA
jgi:prolyl-tRNA synthetase